MLAAAGSGTRPAPAELQPPFIVRITGLPAEVMAPFSSELLLGKIEEYEHLQEQLKRSRAALVESLHAAMREISKERRGFLLSVKRDCFNDRSLGAHKQNPHWRLLAEVGGGLVNSTLDLEERAVGMVNQLYGLYHSEMQREWSALLRLLEHRDFMRGVTLASTELAQSLQWLQGKPVASFGNKERRLTLSLLRYASRAALKLSPFASLGRIGVGVLGGEESSRLEISAADRWREQPVVRLHRELLYQCLCLLLSCPAFIQHLQIGLNDSLEPIRDDRYSFFRPCRWEFDAANKVFQYRDEASIRARLDGPLVKRLMGELRDGPAMYGDLLHRLRAADESPDLVEESVAELLDVGFLTSTLPWESNEPDLEAHLLAYLANLPRDPALAAFAESLRLLLDRLRGYPQAASPLQAIAECRENVESLFTHALAAADPNAQVEFKAKEQIFEEDVFLSGAAASGAREIVRMPRQRADEIAQNLQPLARLAGLDSSQYDLLHALAALGHERWPGKPEVGFLEFYGAARPLFNEYLQYRTKLRGYPTLQAPGFDPFGLAAVRELARLRRSIAGKLDGILQREPQGYRLCTRSLNALLAEIPEAYTSAGEFCAFLQPLDPEGRTWVLNELVEGYGRLSSRYTAAMDDGMRRRWVAYFTALSSSSLQGEPVDLVDVSCADRRTINVHEVQTRRLLRMPGEPSRLPAERRLQLKDLRVRLRGPDRFPVLTDGAGRRLLPVQLGGLSAILGSITLKFLAAFGPAEIPDSRLLGNPRKVGNVEILDRHVAGNVVYLRKRWLIGDKDSLPSAAKQTSGAWYFSAVHRWRVAQGIPQRVYVMESLGASSGYRKKPQYIDFSSPSFVQIFESILRTHRGRLVLTEALPAPGDYLGGCSRWGLELQLESLVLDTHPLQTPPVRNEGMNDLPNEWAN